MRGFKGHQINIFKFLYLVLHVIYLFQAIRGLNKLNFRGYNKLYSDFTHFEVFQNRRNCPILDPSENELVLSGTSKFWFFFVDYQSLVCSSSFELGLCMIQPKSSSANNKNRTAKKTPKKPKNAHSGPSKIVQIISFFFLIIFYFKTVLKLHRNYKQMKN